MIHATQHQPRHFAYDGGFYHHPHGGVYVPPPVYLGKAPDCPLGNGFYGGEFGNYRKLFPQPSTLTTNSLSYCSAVWWYSLTHTSFLFISSWRSVFGSLMILSYPYLFSLPFIWRSILGRRRSKCNGSSLSLHGGTARCSWNGHIWTSLSIKSWLLFSWILWFSSKGPWLWTDGLCPTMRCLYFLCFCRVYSCVFYGGVDGIITFMNLYFVLG